jgi:hypothetical protein
MQYTPESFWNQSGTSESMADDLRLAHRFMDLSEHTQDSATSRECYEKARSAHETVDRLLRSNLPVCPVVRGELGSAIASLRTRLAAYQTAHPWG